MPRLTTRPPQPCANLVGQRSGLAVRKLHRPGEKLRPDRRCLVYHFLLFHEVEVWSLENSGEFWRLGDLTLTLTQAKKGKNGTMQ